MKTYPIRDVTGDKYLNPATKFISFSSLKAFGGVVFLTAWYIIKRNRSKA